MTKQTCRDCGTKHGTLHKSGCDFELCGICGQQATTCDCNPDESQKAPRIPYRGEFPDDPEETKLVSSKLKPWLITLLILLLIIFVIAPAIM